MDFAAMNEKWARLFSADPPAGTAASNPPAGTAASADPLDAPRLLILTVVLVAA